jgi:hypothetical protein
LNNAVAYNINSGSEEIEITHNYGDGNTLEYYKEHIYFGTYDGNIIGIDVNDFSITLDLSFFEGDCFIDIDKQNGILYATGSNTLNGNTRPSFLIYDLNSDEYIKKYIQEYNGEYKQNNKFDSVAFSQDHIYGGTGDGQIFGYNLDTFNREIEIQQNDNSHISSLGYDLVNNILWAGDWDGLLAGYVDGVQTYSYVIGTGDYDYVTRLKIDYENNLIWHTGSDSIDAYDYENDQIKYEVTDPDGVFGAFAFDTVNNLFWFATSNNYLKADGTGYKYSEPTFEISTTRHPSKIHINNHPSSKSKNVFPPFQNRG